MAKSAAYSKDFHRCDQPSDTLLGAEAEIAVESIAMVRGQGSESMVDGIIEEAGADEFVADGVRGHSRRASSVYLSVSYRRDDGGGSVDRRIHKPVIISCMSHCGLLPSVSILGKQAK